MTKPRVLVTLTEPAVPADTGKRIRAAAMVRALSGMAELDIMLLHRNYPAGQRPVSADIPTRYWSVVRKSRVNQAKALLKTVSGLPYQIALQDWSKGREEILLRRSVGWDLVWFGSLDHFVMLRDLITECPCIVDYDDVEPEKIRAFLAVAPRDVRGRIRRTKVRIETIFWRQLERLADRHCAAILVCSDLDVQRLGLRRGVAVPNTYPDPGTTVRRLKNDPEFLMIGNFHYGPNVDAASFMVECVLPRLRRTLPNAVVHFAGHAANEYLHSMTGVPGLKISSNVSEVRSLLEAATAVIAPIRYGSGTRMKIIEAWAHGVPVVSTHFGAEGLGGSNGVDIILADEPGDFAAACERLAVDATLREKVAGGGRSMYESAYRPEAAEVAIAHILKCALERDAYD
jgi:glycosyltransferase involved in cell wall biosynthesis